MAVITVAVITVAVISMAVAGTVRHGAGPLLLRGLVLVVVVLVVVMLVGIGLSQGWSRPDPGEQQWSNQRTHGGRQDVPLPCTLLPMESQVSGSRLALAASPVLQKIGAVAQRSGVSVKTIRFYCDQGLLQPRTRSEGHYRLFDERVFDELALIRMLRALEIPLATIREVLQARRSGICHCDELKSTIGSKAGEIEQRIGDLQHLHGELTRMLDSWQACGGRTQSDRSVA